jgi:hypothetical protein
VLHLLRIERDGAFTALISHPESSNERTYGDVDVWAFDEDAIQEGRGVNQEPADVQKPGNGPGEARTVTWLVASVTRWRRQLDSVVSTLTQRSADGLDPPVRQVSLPYAPVRTLAKLH